MGFSVTMMEFPLVVGYFEAASDLEILTMNKANIIYVCIPCETHSRVFENTRDCVLTTATPSKQCRKNNARLTFGSFS